MNSYPQTSDLSTPDSVTAAGRSLFTTATFLLVLASLMLASCAKVEPQKSESSVVEAQQQEPETQVPVVVEPVKLPVVKKQIPIKRPSKFKNNAEKKRFFFAYMKPFVKQENERIRKLRGRLIEMQAAQNLSKDELRWLSDLAKRYRVKMSGSPDRGFWNQLISGVDVVPVEMALVQAANESAWGQSRFATEGNNFFGQWCYSKGCGIVPSQRDKGFSHEVRRFDSPAESVSAYILNINRTRAYRELRKIRSELRKQKLPLDAEKLALGLKSYSERGMEYVKTIQSMIRSNRKLIKQS